MVEERALARFNVRLTPRGGRDAIGVVAGDTVRVRVAAAPVGGAANEALIRLLAKRLRVGRRSVRIARGATTTHKQVEVDGVTTADALRRLIGPVAGEHPPR
ncbi:MAG: DUF167 family protein [Chloroflexi bacterium]|nr:DUF167 family protein [Chloroflexota bacterium]